ncbi:MAG: hypothetical protein JNL34_04160 [Anaerolineae bacterium]|nr:hypothetical protein [Anaerolineae bacterium]
MKKALALLAGMALMAVPAFAQDSTNTASLNGLGLSFPASFATSVVGTQVAGDALDDLYPGGPQPAYTGLMFFSEPPAPQSMFEHGGVRLVHVADAVDYPFTQTQIDALAALLAERPDLNEYMETADDNALNLPFLPTFPAAQILRARAEYVDTPELSGISYVTAFRQDVSPLIASEFLYTFQGLTADGQTYVAAVFPVTAPGFPAEYPANLDYDAFVARLHEYFNESITALNAADGETFVPALSTLDSIIQSITAAQ